jgi:serine/threonine-protein kinase HipA
MTANCTLQIHVNGGWRDTASVSLFGPEENGWKAASYSGYTTDWALEHASASDARALCAGWPVGLEPLQLPHWPVFLIDLLPQGFGRAELLRRLNLPVTSGAATDWRLLLAGAGNPIGNLRVKEAAEWIGQDPGPSRGFTDDEVGARSDGFAEYLASHGLFVAGSSGVQGGWPKVLLTRAKDGLLYLDHTLGDDQAVEHYIVKFGRGADPQLAHILKLEAPYMDIAAFLGLRVHSPLKLRERALFIPRFDRRVQGQSVIRLAQESIATLTGIPGFEAVPDHYQVCRALIRHCTNPQDEVLEYIKRDVANLAFGNKDNHARNTAVQRKFDGHIALTPLYDFAPMYLHPDGIARRIRWRNDDQGGQPNWALVLDYVCELGALAQKEGRGRTKGRPLTQRESLVAGLKAMAPALEDVANQGERFGLDTETLHHLRPGILARAQELADLT